MDKETVLSELHRGGRALVLDITPEEGMRHRLQELGLIPGTDVACVRKSPLGDPSAYLIRGAVVALRRKDAAQVRVRILSGTETAGTREEQLGDAEAAGWA